MARLPIFTKNQITRAVKPLGSNPIHGSNLGTNTQITKQPVGLTADPTNPYALRTALDTPIPDGDFTNAPSTSANPRVMVPVKPVNRETAFVPLTGGAQFKAASQVNQPKPWHDDIDLTTKPGSTTAGQIHPQSAGGRPAAPAERVLISFNNADQSQPQYADFPVSATPVAAKDTSVHGVYNDTALDGAPSPSPKSQPIKSTAGSIQNLYMNSGGAQSPFTPDVPVTNSSGGKGGMARRTAFLQTPKKIPTGPRSALQSLDG
jgi:hypothetical protein